VRYANFCSRREQIIVSGRRRRFPDTLPDLPPDGAGEGTASAGLETIRQE
jgi:hypothetical protein